MLLSKASYKWGQRKQSKSTKEQQYASAVTSLSYLNTVHVERIIIIFYYIIDNKKTDRNRES